MVVTIPIHKRWTNEGLMRLSVITDDVTALVDDRGDVARTEDEHSSIISGLQKCVVSAGCCLVHNTTVGTYSFVRNTL